MADAIYEHKRGKVWVIVGRQEQEIRALRYQVKVLQARCRKEPCLFPLPGGRRCCECDTCQVTAE